MITLQPIAVPTSDYQLEVYYALYDKHDNRVYYQETSSIAAMPLTHYGDLKNFMNMKYNAVVIPIDPFTACHLNWITHDEALVMMGFTEDVRAAIRLVT